MGESNGPSTIAPEPRFIDVGGRYLFCIRYRCSIRPRFRVLIVPPFGEELNKCRAMLSRTARALAARGCDVLLPDLSCTGDSPGDFEDADWSLWCEDVRACHEWLAREAPDSRSVVLAVRCGALLLVQTVLTAGAHVLLWQPVLNGARYLQQVLRLRVLAAKFAGSEESVATLQARFAAGQPVEVAGYALSPELAAGMTAARLEARALVGARRVTSFEFRTVEGAEVSPSTQDLVAALAETGCDAEALGVVADQFWTTQEISAPPEVCARTVAAVLDGDIA